MNKKQILTLLFCILIICGLGFTSGLITQNEIKNWYQYLQKPFFNPPNWIFGPVWTIIYIFIGIVLYRIIYVHKLNKKLLTLFIIQFILNLCWTPIFFGAHQLLLAGIEIIILWIFIFVLMLQLKKEDDKISFYLLLPYLLWVSFASILNWSIFILNK